MKSAFSIAVRRAAKYSAQDGTLMVYLSTARMPTSQHSTFRHEVCALDEKPFRIYHHLLLSVV